jgi:hypothetical protein
MSSLKDLASLIMVPSLVKDGRLDTVKPLGNSIIHPDATGNNDGTDGSTPAEGNFTFSRGSNLAATRVDVNGLIEKGRENLLLQSNNFNTTWSKPNSTLTQGFSGYDGSNNAWKWASTAAATTQLSQGTSGVSGMRTLSIYAKAGSRDVFSIWVGTGIDFNLTTGQAAGHANASMESVGNGWWRCSYFNDYGTLNPYYVASAAGEFIYIMNAQAEQGLVATDYIETGASTAQAGILEDLPRLDYSGGASCPSLLLEPSRTNVIRQSEYFGGWSGAATRTDNYAISPEGVKNAAMLEANSGIGNGVVFIAQVSSSTLYKGSVYVKSAGATTGKFRFFDGSTGQSTTTTFTPTSEWTRVEVQRTSGSSTNQIRADIFDNDGDLLLYGAQMEAGSYPTSYIPTMGSAVTRSSDDVNELTGATSLIGQSEGTLFLDFVANDEDSFQIIYQVRTTGSTNVGQIDFRIQSGNLRVLGNDAGATQFNINAGAAVAGTRYKCAVRYANNNVAFYVNGVLKGTDTSASFSSSSLDQITFNENGTTFYPSVNVNQALIIPTALPNTELADLTTL